MRLLCLSLIALVAIAAPARADQTAESKAAMRHFDEGSKFFALGDFVHAIEEYKAGYQLKPTAEFLFNIAQAYRLSNDPRQACFFYKSYLAHAPNAENRDEVEGRIHGCEEQLAKLPAAPPPVVVTPQPEPRPALVAAAPPPHHDSAARKWWVWTLVGVGVAGGAVALGLTLGLPPRPPSSTLGTTRVF